MEPPTCPESISEPPRIHIWQSHVGLPKLAMSRRYYKICFPNFLFLKKSTSHSPSGISSRSKKLLQVILYLSAFSKKSCTYKLFFWDSFEFLVFSSSYLHNFTKTIFSILSLLGVILQRLCSRQVPHVASHPGSLYPGFSDPWLGFPGLAGWLQICPGNRAGGPGGTFRADHSPPPLK